MKKKSNATPLPKKTRAVAYVRSATVNPQSSASNQMDVIQEYAAKNKMEIVRAYSDEGKSGLNIKGHQALRRMIQDVQFGKPDFSAILVYDVSRWGRFQEFDESAKIEHLCRRAGITIHYCAETFVNDGNFGASVVKFLKRLMAAEYKRETVRARRISSARRDKKKGKRKIQSASLGL